MRIETKRLVLRPFEQSDYDDLYEFLSRLEKDEFEGYPGITYENGKKYLADRGRPGTLPFQREQRFTLLLYGGRQRKSHSGICQSLH